VLPCGQQIVSNAGEATFSFRSPLGYTLSTCVVPGWSVNAVAKATRKETAWYKDGLQFECTQCGNCCTGPPGYVFVTKKERGLISAFLERQGLSLGSEHVRRVGHLYSLTEDKTSGDCCFLRHTTDGKRTCGIYPVRPLQCRTWPFWNGNLASEDTWAEAASGCPGMSRGQRHDFVQIEIRRTARRWEDLAPCPSHAKT